MKVVFLDVDGVLNSMQALINGELSDEGFGLQALSRKLVYNLGTIILGSGAKVVLSSTWRDDWGNPNNPYKQTLEYYLKREGVFVHDITPHNSKRIRGLEIMEWLNGKTDIESFVILDDDFHDIMPYFKDNLVAVDSTLGLTTENVAQALEILNKPLDNQA